MRKSGLLYGALGAVAATAAAGVAVERVVSGRRRAGRDLSPFVDEPPADRVGTVMTDDGVPLAVQEVGPRRAPLTVVFVHGFTLTSRTFVRQRRALADAFGDRIRMVFFDQRGHGASGAAPDGTATIERLGRDLLGVLDHLAANGPVVLVAHSMGGMTVMSAAELRPALFAGRSARVRGLALIATSAFGMREVGFGLPRAVGRLHQPLTPVMLKVARGQAGLVEHGRRLGADVAWAVTRRLSFGDRSVDPATVDFLDAIISATGIESIADFYPAVMDHDGRAGLAVLAAARARIVVVGAEKDVMTPYSHSEAIAAALPAAALVTVPGAGHVVMLERPDVIDEVLTGLVDDALATTTKRSAG